MKKQAIAIGLFAALLPGTGLFHAAAAKVQIQTGGSDCAILPSDLDALTAAEAQGFAAELAARRTLLAKTIQCAQANGEALINELDALPVDAGAAPIRDEFVGKLNDAETYYGLELGKVKDAGIAGTQAIARETLDWRAANFAPLTDQISNFILWKSNQALMKTANDRLNQMKNIVAFLQQAGEQADLENLLGSASGLVQSANDENEAARKALAQLLPAGQSLDLIKQSLSSLADAYGKFTAMSAIIQKLLPTSAK